MKNSWNPLINCEINFILTWSNKSVLSNDAKETLFAITDTNLYVPFVTLSTQMQWVMQSYYNNWNHVFNPNLGGLFRDSFWGGGGVKLPHPLSKTF